MSVQYNSEVFGTIEDGDVEQVEVTGAPGWSSAEVTMDDVKSYLLVTHPEIADLDISSVKLFACGEYVTLGEIGSGSDWEAVRHSGTITIIKKNAVGITCQVQLEDASVVVPVWKEYFVAGLFDGGGSQSLRRWDFLPGSKSFDSATMTESNLGLGAVNFRKLMAGSNGYLYASAGKVMVKVRVSTMTIEATSAEEDGTFSNARIDPVCETSYGIIGKCSSGQGYVVLDKDTLATISGLHQLNDGSAIIVSNAMNPQYEAGTAPDTPWVQGYHGSQGKLFRVNFNNVITNGAGTGYEVVDMVTSTIYPMTSNHLESMFIDGDNYDWIAGSSKRIYSGALWPTPVYGAYVEPTQTWLNYGDQLTCIYNGDVYSAITLNAKTMYRHDNITGTVDESLGLPNDQGPFYDIAAGTASFNIVVGNFI